MDKKIAAGIVVLALILIAGFVVFASSSVANLANEPNPDPRAFVLNEAKTKDFRVFSNTENLYAPLSQLDAEGGTIVVDNGGNDFWTMEDSVGARDFELMHLVHYSSGTYKVFLFDCKGWMGGNDVSVSSTLWGTGNIKLQDILQECAGINDDNTYPFPFDKLAATSKKNGWHYTDVVGSGQTTPGKCDSITGCMAKIDQKLVDLFK